MEKCYMERPKIKKDRLELYEFNPKTKMMDKIVKKLKMVK